ASSSARPPPRSVKVKRMSPGAILRELQSFQDTTVIGRQRLDVDMGLIRDEATWIDRIALERKAEREWSDRWGSLNDPRLYLGEDAPDKWAPQKLPSKWSPFNVAPNADMDRLMKIALSNRAVPGHVEPTWKITGERHKYRSQLAKAAEPTQRRSTASLKTPPKRRSAQAGAIGVVGVRGLPQAWGGAVSRSTSPSASSSAGRRTPSGQTSVHAGSATGKLSHYEVEALLCPRTFKERARTAQERGGDGRPSMQQTVEADRRSTAGKSGRSAVRRGNPMDVERERQRRERASSAARTASAHKNSMGKKETRGRARSASAQSIANAAASERKSEEEIRAATPMVFMRSSTPFSEARGGVSSSTSVTGGVPLSTSVRDGAIVKPNERDFNNGHRVPTPVPPTRGQTPAPAGDDDDEYFDLNLEPYASNDPTSLAPCLSVTPLAVPGYSRPSTSCSSRPSTSLSIRPPTSLSILEQHHHSRPASPAQHSRPSSPSRPASRASTMARFGQISAGGGADSDDDGDEDDARSCASVTSTATARAGVAEAWRHLHASRVPGAQTRYGFPPTTSREYGWSWVGAATLNGHSGGGSIGGGARGWVGGVGGKTTTVVHGRPLEMFSTSAHFAREAWKRHLEASKGVVEEIEG
ncbi:hypothetical protein HK101_006385, partial [Irineochytrium annulatum]